MFLFHPIYVKIKIMLTNIFAPYGNETSYHKDGFVWGLSDPETPEEILFEALNENLNATLPSILCNPAIPHQMVWHILNNHAQSNISNLSSNPSLTPEMMKRLLKLRGNELKVQRNIINAPHVTTDVLEYFIKTFPGDIDVSFPYVFSKPNAPIYLLFRLAFTETYKGFNTLTFRQKVARKKIEELGIGVVKRAFLERYELENLSESVDMVPVEWFVELGEQFY